MSKDHDTHLNSTNHITFTKQIVSNVCLTVPIWNIDKIFYFLLCVFHCEWRHLVLRVSIERAVILNQQYCWLKNRLIQHQQPALAMSSQPNDAKKQKKVTNLIISRTCWRICVNIAPVLCPWCYSTHYTVCLICHFKYLPIDKTQLLEKPPQSTASR